MEKKVYCKPFVVEIELSVFNFVCAASNPYGEDNGVPEDIDDNIIKSPKPGSNLWEDE
ncbi:MAG: hypothetical protein IKX24_12780 [Prevotella sp.]|nr:hypothetical protein [Prevotella sp.]